MLKNMKVKIIFTALVIVTPLLNAEDANTAMERFFRQTVEANAKGAKTGEYAETRKFLNDMFSFMDNNLDTAADYLVNKRLIGDDKIGIPILGELIWHFCEMAPDEQVFAFLQRMLESADYGKRCFWVSFFWQPTTANDKSRKIAEFCMQYLDKHQVNDEVAWALFGYLRHARHFYDNGSQSKQQMAWVKKHVLHSRSMYCYFANEIMMSQFPWNNELGKIFQTQVSSSQSDPFAVAGVVEGMASRLTLCAQFMTPGGLTYQKTDDDYLQDKLIPAPGIHQLAVAVSKNMRRMITVKSPIGALRLDIRNPHESLLYYLGILDYNSSFGKELMACFVENASIENVIKLFAEACDSQGELGKNSFPTLAKQYGDIIFYRIKQEQERSLGEAKHLFAFVHNYFASASIPENDKERNRKIWQQITDVAVANE